MTRAGPFTVKVVRGKPIRVYGRTLTLVARIVWAIKHQGTVRQDGVGGQGWGMVHIEPIAVIEEGGGAVRHLPIQGSTGWMLRRMALAAVVVSALTATLMAACWLRRARQQGFDREV
jgi:hypothetical protein